MSRFKEHEAVEKAKYEFPNYSNQELRGLNILLEQKYNGGKTANDVMQWYQDQGALNNNGAVIVTGYDFKTNKGGELYPVCDYPSKFILLQDKLEKAIKLQGRKEYAIKKELEELSKEKSIINETQLQD